MIKFHLTRELRVIQGLVMPILRSVDLDLVFLLLLRLTVLSEWARARALYDPTGSSSC